LKKQLDQAVRSLEETVEQKTELLRTKELALNALENRFSQTIRSLENQLTEKDELLVSRDADLKALGSKVNQLDARLAELDRANDQDARLLREELTRKTELLQVKDAAIKKLEEQFVGQIHALESQIDEKQNLLATSDTELASLMAKVSELTRERAELVLERENSDRLIREKLPAKAALLQAKESSISEMEERMPSDPEPIVPPSPPRQDRNSGWLSGFQRAWQIPSRPKTFPATALSAAAVGLFTIPIGYFVLGHHHTGPNSPDTAAQARLPVTIVESSMVEEEHGTSAARLVESKARKTIGADNRDARKREDRPEAGDTYVTRRAVSLRGEPRFAATAKAEIGAGTSISVLGAQGDWLKVKTRPSGAVGYVRKEYLVPQG
jgi:hypothetical protein